jgi:hypothetical protein
VVLCAAARGRKRKDRVSNASLKTMTRLYQIPVLFPFLYRGVPLEARDRCRKNIAGLLFPLRTLALSILFSIPQCRMLPVMHMAMAMFISRLQSHYAHVLPLASEIRLCEGSCIINGARSPCPSKLKLFTLVSSGARLRSRGPGRGAEIPTWIGHSRPALRRYV